MCSMATNLRLRADAEAALRDAASRTGRSQQELIREAVDEYLGIGPTGGRAGARLASDTDALIDAGLVRPAREAFRHAGELLTLPDGVSTADLLERDDRR